MYTNKPIRRKDAVGREVLSGNGLGADIPGLITSLPVVNQIPMVNTFGQKKQEGYEGISKTGTTVQSSISMLDTALPMFGFKFIGKLLDTFGLFKKATHMGDCMKWWSDSNIKGMASGVEPYSFDFNDYMMKNFPQFLKRYQTMQADGTWANVGVDRLLSSTNRRARVGRIFLRIVRQNPDVMTLQCAVRERAETGYTGYTQSQVDDIWGQIKEAARQEEYSTIAQEVDRLVAPFKVKETWGAIVKSRNEQLAVRQDQGSQMKIADNVIGVKRGAFVQVLKGPSVEVRG